MRYPLFIIFILVSSWASYVSGSIAFLEKDKVGLLEAHVTLKEQEYQMNIEILESFLKNFNKPYSEAYCPVN